MAKEAIRYVDEKGMYQWKFEEADPVVEEVKEEDLTESEKTEVAEAIEDIEKPKKSKKSKKK